jgi:hypothetical protein
MERRRTWGTRIGGAPGRARWFEGAHGDLEAVDHLAGATGVDGVLGEAVDDGGEGDEDAGAVLDGRNLHAGDLGVDEDAVVFLVGDADEVVVAVVFAFECRRAATLAGWGLVVVAVVFAIDVWKWLRHGAPWGMRFSQDRPNKPLSTYDRENKRDVFKINKMLELWFLWSFEERTQA